MARAIEGASQGGVLREMTVGRYCVLTTLSHLDAMIVLCAMLVDEGQDPICITAPETMPDLSALQTEKDDDGNLHFTVTLRPTGRSVRYEVPRAVYEEARAQLTILRVADVEDGA
jgi:hypothetical protein